MTNHEEIDALATSFFQALENQNIDRMAEIYADDATVWKNYDQKAISKKDSLAFVGGVGAYLKDIKYQNVRRYVFDGGFAQNHIFTGTVRETGDKLEIPVCLIAKVADGHITSIEEYLDSAHRLPIRVQN